MKFFPCSMYSRESRMEAWLARDDSFRLAMMGVPCVCMIEN